MHCGIYGISLVNVFFKKISKTATNYSELGVYPLHKTSHTQLARRQPSNINKAVAAPYHTILCGREIAPGILEARPENTFPGKTHTPMRVHCTLHRSQHKTIKAPSLFPSGCAQNLAKSLPNTRVSLLSLQTCI